MLIRAYSLVGSELRGHCTIAGNRRALNGVLVTPSNALSSAANQAPSAYSNPSNFHKTTQNSNRKTREKRSVSVVHNCAEKNSERIFLEDYRQLYGRQLLYSRR
jgi:hypothetical protein